MAGAKWKEDANPSHAQEKTLDNRDKGAGVLPITGRYPGVGRQRKARPGAERRWKPNREPMPRKPGPVPNDHHNERGRAWQGAAQWTQQGRQRGQPPALAMGARLDWGSNSVLTPAPLLLILTRSCCDVHPDSITHPCFAIIPPLLSGPSLWLLPSIHHRSCVESAPHCGTPLSDHHHLHSTGHMIHIAQTSRSPPFSRPPHWSAPLPTFHAN